MVKILIPLFFSLLLPPAFAGESFTRLKPFGENTPLQFIEERLQLNLQKQTLNLHEIDGLKYLGFFDHREQKILIDSQLNEIEKKITLVHELTHWLRYRYQTHEEDWLNEGLAKLIEHLYSRVWPVSYTDTFKTKHTFTLWKSKESFQPKGKGYSTSFYFIYYLYTHFGGDELLHELVTSPYVGWENILTSIGKVNAAGVIKIPGVYISRESIIRHFAISFLMNDTFLAKYSLFYLHAFHSYSIPDVPETGLIESPKDFDFQIRYSRQPFPDTEAETWEIPNSSSFSIQKQGTAPSVNGASYIQIVY